MAHIAQVYINSPSPSLDREFHYSVPEKYVDSVKIGMRVKVPFGTGNRQMEAYVTDLLDGTDYPHLKDLIRPIDEEPVLTAEAIELCRYVSKYCFCTFVSAIHLFLPPGLEIKFLESVYLTDAAGTEEGKKFISKSEKRRRLVEIIRANGGSAEVEQLKGEMGKGAGAIISALIKNGIVEKTIKEKQKANEKFIRVYYYSAPDDPYELSRRMSARAPSQSAVIDLLADGGEYTAADIEAAAGVSRSAVELLADKGYLSYKNIERIRNPFDGKEFTGEKPLPLTEQQRAALDTILHNTDPVYLLHGVTGSGKTEVYMQAAAACISEGKQVLILVPEIALTSQITDRFFRRFGDMVAVVHSALSMGERLDSWRRIKRGEAKIIVGARSAVFAPCERLGLIIIDEEHETSYKSESNPRYNAKNIAIMRGRLNNCKVVLASATPSVETYYMAKSGACRLIEMTARYNENPLPKVKIVDMRKELAEGNKSVLSRRLAVELSENIKKGEQSILLLNRRGYSTFVSCRSCGYVFVCPNCSVSMTYHRDGESLVCHMCGSAEPAPHSCPKCGSDKVRDFGKGTQKAEAQIREIFPDAAVLRMDVDTTGGKRGHEKIIESFEKDRVDILLGTQMVAKGLDFSGVTLVGVLAADAALNADDFRASERCFNLITQVCGRAGRGDTAGRAIVQTYSPESSVIQCAARQDYKAFYREEIEYRRIFRYPPFCKIVQLLFSSADEAQAQAASGLAAEELRQAVEAGGYSDVEIYGPSEAPISRIQGRYRWRLWLKCTRVDELVPVIGRIAKKTQTRAGADLSVAVDINPNSMN